jgi:RsiW-degrading membrane proteinase PrsW (M82 family)
MLETMLNMFRSFYDIPGLSVKMVFIAIGIALVFGAIWLAFYLPGLLKKGWGWLILIASAVITWCAIAFIQVPLQSWYQDFMLRVMGNSVFVKYLALTGIPLILISGLVQEGTKLLPVIFFWLKNGKQLDLRTGLIAGAISGAGFGLFEAIWVHNSVLASGFTWSTVQLYGATALMSFWERFFVVGMHIAAGAIAGYGLAKGKGWQFYLIAAGIHALTNYGVILISLGLLNSIEIEIYIAVIAVLATVAALWLRRKANLTAGPDDQDVSPALPQTESEAFMNTDADSSDQTRE